MHARSVASAMSVWRVSVVTSHSNSAKRAPKIPFSQCSPTCTRAVHMRCPCGAHAVSACGECMPSHRPSSLSVVLDGRSLHRHLPAVGTAPAAAASAPRRLALGRLAAHSLLRRGSELRQLGLLPPPRWHGELGEQPGHVHVCMSMHICMCMCICMGMCMCLRIGCV